MMGIENLVGLFLFVVPICIIAISAKTVKGSLMMVPGFVLLITYAKPDSAMGTVVANGIINIVGLLLLIWGLSDKPKETGAVATIDSTDF